MPPARPVCPMIMGGQLSGPGAQAMAQEIHKQLIAQAKPLATLTAEEMYQAAIALSRGNWSPETIGAATAAWVRAGENFAQAPPELLVELVARLDQAGEDGKDARVKVADRLEAAVLADPAKARGITILQWDRLVSVLAKDLARSRQASWGVRLHTIFVADAAALAKCTLNDCASLQNKLRQLAHPEADKVLVEWVEKTTAWQGRPFDELPPLGEALCRLGKPAQGALARVAAYVEGKYMGDGAALAAVGASRWDALCGAMGKSLPPAAAAGWAGKLWAGFVADRARLAALTAGDCARLDGMLTTLGARGTCEWIQQTQAWKPLALNELGDLALRAAPGGQAAATRVIDVIGARHVTDPAGAKALGLNGIGSLIGSLGKILPARTAQAWAAAIVTIFVEDQAELAKLTADGCGVVDGLLKQLGMPGPPSAYLAWVEKTDSWQAGDLAALTAMIARIAAFGEAGLAAHQRVVELIEKAYLSDPGKTRSISIRQWWNVSPYLARRLSETARREWVRRLRAAYVDDAAACAAMPSTDVIILSKVLESLGDPASGAVFGQWLTRRPGA
ncbi:MAG: hypothetical protein NTV86_10260 [Planctomycetota bacterium]|nr:hypothetical protein [Planctomycetota bacterium]